MDNRLNTGQGIVDTAIAEYLLRIALLDNDIRLLRLSASGIPVTKYGIWKYFARIAICMVPTLFAICPSPAIVSAAEVNNDIPLFSIA